MVEVRVRPSCRRPPRPAHRRHGTHVGRHAAARPRRLPQHFWQPCTDWTAQARGKVSHQSKVLGSLSHPPQLLAHTRSSGPEPADAAFVNIPCAGMVCYDTILGSARTRGSEKLSASNVSSSLAAMAGADGGHTYVLQAYF